MSEVSELLAKLKSEGICVVLDGMALRVESKSGPLNDEVRQTLKKNKPEIMRVLKEEQPKPYLAPNGDLVISFESDPRYHWWKPGGLHSWEIKKELLKRMVN